MIPRLLLVLIALASIASPRALPAQDDGLDNRVVALTYHKVTREPFDARAVAARSDAMRAASSFDKPDVLRVQVAQLERELAASNPGREFVVRVNDNISDYDHDRAEFSIMLFRPGYYVPLDVFGQQYRLVFANAEAARAIPMAKEPARVFDAKLAPTGRSVVNEIHFRVTGAGDPAGAITGPRVIRGEIVSVRLLDRNGAAVYAPSLVAVASRPSAATGSTSKTVDLAATDIAGMHVGVRSRDLEATLGRLFGPVKKRARSASWFAGYSSALLVNEMGCMELPNGRRPPQPGAVCVTAYTDEGDVVRSIRVERVFPYMDQEVFRSTLVKKYGPVTRAAQAGATLGWGPAFDSSLVASGALPGTAITAWYLKNESLFGQSLNSLPRTRVVLELVDAAWVSARKQ